MAPSRSLSPDSRTAIENLIVCHNAASLRSSAKLRLSTTPAKASAAEDFHHHKSYAVYNSDPTHTLPDTGYARGGPALEGARELSETSTTLTQDNLRGDAFDTNVLYPRLSEPPISRVTWTNKAERQEMGRVIREESAKSNLQRSQSLIEVEHGREIEESRKTSDGMYVTQSFYSQSVRALNSFPQIHPHKSRPAPLYLDLSDSDSLNFQQSLEAPQPVSHSTSTTLRNPHKALTATPLVNCTTSRGSNLDAEQRPVSISESAPAAEIPSSDNHIASERPKRTQRLSYKAAENAAAEREGLEVVEKVGVAKVERRVSQGARSGSGQSASSVRRRSASAQSVQSTTRSRAPSLQSGRSTSEQSVAGGQAHTERDPSVGNQPAKPEASSVVGTGARSINPKGRFSTSALVSIKSEVGRSPVADADPLFVKKAREKPVLHKIPGRSTSGLTAGSSISIGKFGGKKASDLSVSSHGISGEWPTAQVSGSSQPIYSATSPTVLPNTGPTPALATLLKNDLRAALETSTSSLTVPLTASPVLQPGHSIAPVSIGPIKRGRGRPRKDRSSTAPRASKSTTTAPISAHEMAALGISKGNTAAFHTSTSLNTSVPLSQSATSPNAIDVAKKNKARHSLPAPSSKGQADSKIDVDAEADKVSSKSNAGRPIGEESFEKAGQSVLKADGAERNGRQNVLGLGAGDLGTGRTGKSGRES